MKFVLFSFLLLPMFAHASPGPEISRRTFLIGLGGAAVEFSTPASLFPKVSASTAPFPDIHLGVYDTMIHNEGWATFMGHWQNKIFYAPNWKSVVGAGPWMKLYKDFQARWPSDSRFSLESDRAFYKHASRLMEENKFSAQALFKIAFPDENIGAMDLQGLARLSLSFITQDSGIALDLITEDFLIGVRSIEISDEIIDEVVVPQFPTAQTLNRFYAESAPSDHEISMLEHLMGHQGFDPPVTRLDPWDLGSDAWTVVRKKFARAYPQLQGFSLDRAFLKYAQKIAASLDDEQFLALAYDLGDLPIECELVLEAPEVKTPHSRIN